MMEWARPAALCIVAMSSACGDPGTDDAVDPDAGNGDTTPPTIVSSVPADGERPVSVLADISVTFDEALDPATVTSETLVLHVAGQRWTIPGSVDLDADTRTATFAPTAALSYGVSYELAVVGVSDLAGNATDAATVAFETYRNPVLREVAYASGAVNGWTAHELDDDGDRVESLFYIGAGLDDVWFTSDDVEDARYRYEYDTAKRPTLAVIYGLPGNDGIWGNGDDEVSEFFVSTYDSAGRRLRQTMYENPGTDLVWFTSDDVVGRYTQYEYDATGQLVRFTRHNAAGVDGVWFTADDTPYSYQINVWDDLGRRQALANLGGTGPDNAWFTADDDILYAFGSRYFAGRSDAQIEYGLTLMGPGVDETWGTTDDLIDQYSEGIYEAALSTGSRSFDDPGIDQTWFTGDDHVSGREWFTQLGAKGLLGRYVLFAESGADGDWFTPDDVVAYYRDLAFDELGNISSQSWGAAAGLDNAWFSADDELSSTATFDTTR